MPSASTSGESLGAGDAAGPPRRAGCGRRGSLLRAAFACLLLAALLWAFGRASDSGPRLHGQALTPRPAPAFAGLLDTRGEAFHWVDARGAAVLVFFGYTHCPDVCPLTLERVAHVLGELGPRARDVRVVFVTLDPQRDTPGVLRAYLDALLPGAVGLRGDAAATARAARQWGVSWRRERPQGAAASDADYWLDHTAAVTLVGPDGRLRARYGYAQLVAAGLLRDDLRTLLAPRPGASAEPRAARSAQTLAAAPSHRSSRASDDAQAAARAAGWAAPAWAAWFGAIALAWLGYAAIARRGRWPAWRHACFGAGCVLTGAAAWGLHDPLQSMSSYAAALMLMGQGVSPLLLLGVPVEQRAGWRLPAHRAWAGWLLDPWVAGSVFVLLTLALNLPGVFDTALGDALYSGPFGVLLLLGGLMMWAQLLDGSRGIRRRWLAGAVGWLAGLPMMLVAAVWVWSPHVLYMPYLDVLCLWNLSPLQDQHYAGLAMFVAGLPLQLRAAWLLIMGDAA